MKYLYILEKINQQKYSNAYDLGNFFRALARICKFAIVAVVTFMRHELYRNFETEYTYYGAI